jgi:hypothetical protein
MSDESLCDARGTYFENTETTLTAQSPKNDTPPTSTFRAAKQRILIQSLRLLQLRLHRSIKPDIPPCLSDSLSPQLPHLLVLVPFSREFLVVWVVPEGGDRGVRDHDGFEVESTVADVAMLAVSLIQYSRRETHINASTSGSSFGAVHPSTSPGLNGFTCGTTISYAPRQTPNSSALTRIK